MANVSKKSLDEKIVKSKEFVPVRLLNDIKDFVINSSAAELSHINPYKFASERKYDRIEALKAFLYLTKNGLFNLYWSVHCPSCKGISQNSNKLIDMKHDSHCEFCNIDYQAGFDRSIEVSFGINPNIVSLENVDAFDVISVSLETEPGITISIDPGQVHYLSLEMKQGNYLLLNLYDKKAVNFVVSDEGTIMPMKCNVSIKRNSGFLEIKKLKEGTIEINIENQTGDVKEFIFSRLKPPSWPSASMVSSLQEFRDLFSSEMLSLNESFSIQSLSFIFTDIKGSTELYERLGDSNAFYLVKEHFYIMEKIVKKNKGAIVKTIGDAIMAVFTDPCDAMLSSIEMIDAFDEFNIKNKTKNSIIIKVGIHSGPCIAVTLNEKIDYFGTTVNIAARVQGLSDGRDVMISENFFKDCKATNFITEKNWKSESIITSLKGLKNNYKIYKLSKD